MTSTLNLRSAFIPNKISSDVLTMWIVTFLSPPLNSVLKVTHPSTSTEFPNASSIETISLYAREGNASILNLCRRPFPVYLPILCLPYNHCLSRLASSSLTTWNFSSLFFFFFHTLSTDLLASCLDFCVLFVTPHLLTRMTSETAATSLVHSLSRFFQLYSHLHSSMYNFMRSVQFLRL